MNATFLSGLRRSLIGKIFSILVVQSFMFYNVTFASIDQAPPVPAVVKQIASKPTIDAVGISKDIGTIKAKHAGKNGKTILHIQDAHCNYEAQTNISKILETLSKDYNINLISVEGADGVVDTSWFKAFPDVEIRREVADYFMKKGEITGAEFLSITKDYPIKLYGAETRELYIKNLNAFTSTYPMKAEMEKYLQDMRTVLNNLKNYIYTKDLKAFDSKVEDYKDKKITLSDYAKYLSVQLKRHSLDLKNYENFSKLVYTLVYEDKIDFEVVNQERTTLIDKLSKSMKDDKLKELVGKSVEFKSGKVSTADYYTYLKATAEENAIDLTKDFPNLANYVIYTRLYEKIDNEKLFDELDTIKDQVKNNLCQNDDQKTLASCWENINILLGLINIKLSNKEYVYYKAHENEFELEFFMNFIKAKISTYNLQYNIDAPSVVTSDNIKKMREFYEIAIARDKALVENTIKAMNDEKTDNAVLITGGFHTEGMSKMLAEKGIAYMVICPSITKDVESPYIQVLTNQRTPFEDLLVESATPTKKDSLLAPCLISSKMLADERESDRLQVLIRRNMEDRKAFIDIYADHYIVKVTGIAQQLNITVTEDLVVSSFISAVNQLIDSGKLTLASAQVADLEAKFRQSVAANKRLKNTTSQTMPSVTVRHIDGLSIGTAGKDVFGINVQELIEDAYNGVFNNAANNSLTEGARLVKVINDFKIAYRAALGSSPQALKHTEQQRETYIANVSMSIIRHEPIRNAITNNLCAFGVSGGDCAGLNTSLASAAAYALDHGYMVIALPRGLEGLTQKNIWHVGVPVDREYIEQIRQRGSINVNSCRASIFAAGKDPSFPHRALITAIKNLTGFTGDESKLQSLLLELVSKDVRVTLDPAVGPVALPDELVTDKDLAKAMIYYRNDQDNAALSSLRKFIHENCDPRRIMKGAIVVGGDDHAVEGFKLSILLKDLVNVNSIFKSIDNDVNALMLGFFTAAMNSRERFLEGCVDDGVMFMEIMGRKYDDLCVRVARKDLQPGSAFYDRLPQRLQKKYDSHKASFISIGSGEYLSLADVAKKVKETYLRAGGRVNCLMAEGYQFWLTANISNVWKAIGEIISADYPTVQQSDAEAIASRIQDAGLTQGEIYFIVQRYILGSKQAKICEEIELSRIKSELANAGISDDPTVRALLKKLADAKPDAHGHKPLAGISKFVSIAVKKALESDPRFGAGINVVRKDLAYSTRGDYCPEFLDDGKTPNPEYALAWGFGQMAARFIISEDKSGHIPYFAELKNGEIGKIRNPADPSEQPEARRVDAVVFKPGSVSKVDVRITNIFTKEQLKRMGLVFPEDVDAISDNALTALRAGFVKAGPSAPASLVEAEALQSEILASTEKSAESHAHLTYMVVPGSDGVLAFNIASANRDFDLMKASSDPRSKSWGYVFESTRDAVVILLPEYQDKITVEDICKAVKQKYEESKLVRDGKALVSVVQSVGFKIKANDTVLLNYIAKNQDTVASSYISIMPDGLTPVSDKDGYAVIANGMSGEVLRDLIEFGTGIKFNRYNDYGNLQDYGTSDAAAVKIIQDTLKGSGVVTGDPTTLSPSPVPMPAAPAVTSTTPGSNASSGDILSAADARILDAMFSESIEKFGLDQRTRRIDNREFSFVVHPELSEAVNAYNKLHPDHTVSVSIRPGRGGDATLHKALQAHLDLYVYERLKAEHPEYLDILAKHELAHLDIFNGDEAFEKGKRGTAIRDAIGAAAFSTWQKWSQFRSGLPHGSDLNAMQEKFINEILGHDTRPINPVIDRMTAEKQRLTVNEMRQAINQNNIPAMIRFLLSDVSYGAAVRKVLIEKKLNAEIEKDSPEINDNDADYIRSEFIRRYNIDMSKGSFTAQPFVGPKKLVVISSTPEETAFKQAHLEHLTAGLPITIDSQAESPNGQFMGQILGVVILPAFRAYQEARKSDANLAWDDFLNEYLDRLMVITDGGRGERSTPLGQIHNLSRAQQYGDDRISDASGKIMRARLIDAVLANVLPYAGSDAVKDFITVIWPSQISSGSVPHDMLTLSKAHFQKMYVPIPAIPREILDMPVYLDEARTQLNPERENALAQMDTLLKGCRQFGTFIMNKDGSIDEFYGNQNNGCVTQKPDTSLVWNTDPSKIEMREKLLRAAAEGRAGYDYGSFFMSKDLFRIMAEYWSKKMFQDGSNLIEGLLAGKALPKEFKRDIDPEFLQPLTIFMSYFSGISEQSAERAALDQAKTRAKTERTAAQLGAISSDLIAAIRADIIEKKKVQAKWLDAPATQDALAFFLAYADSTVFSNPSLVAAGVSLGKGTLWDTFRTARDKANTCLFMLTDMLGAVMEYNVLAELKFDVKAGSNPDVLSRAENMRRRTGITDQNTCDFYVGNKHYVLPKALVAGEQAITVDGVTIHRSIIQGAHLLPGSVIVNSVVYDSQGQIHAENSYVDHFTGNILNAVNSMVYSRITNAEKVSAENEIMGDVFRPGVIDDTRSAELGILPGQTTIEVPWNYDPKAQDATIVGTNKYSLGDDKQHGIRAMKCDKDANEALENTARIIALIRSGQNEALRALINSMRADSLLTPAFIDQATPVIVTALGQPGIEAFQAAASNTQELSYLDVAVAKPAQTPSNTPATPGIFASSGAAVEVTPASMADLIKQNNISSAVQQFATIAENSRPKQLADLSNLLTIYHAGLSQAEKNANLNKMIAFYQGVIAIARASQNSDIAYAIQRISANNLVIAILINRAEQGASDLRVTVDSTAMWNHPAPGTEISDTRSKKLTYLESPKVPTTTTEGALGLFDRKFEDANKLKSNVIQAFAFDQNAKGLENMVMYLMLHGATPAPEGLKTMTEQKQISTMHDTLFINGMIPGSVQHTSTGTGHWQGSKLDIKQVTKGRVLQMTDIFDKDGNKVRTLAHVLNEGDFSRAIPGSMDYMIPLTDVVAFNDFSVEVTEEHLAKLNPYVTGLTMAGLSDIEAKSKAIADNNIAAYSCVELGGKTVLVKVSKQNVALTLIKQAPMQKGVTSLVEFYRNADKAGMNGLISFLAANPMTEMEKHPDVSVQSEMPADLGTFTSSLKKLGEMIRNNELLFFVSLFNTGDKGYMWGQHMKDSYTLKMKGMTNTEERVAFMKATMTKAQIKKYTEEYQDIAGEKPSFDKWLDANMIIAELLVGAGSIDLGENLQAVAMSILGKIWPGEVYGYDHLAQYPAETGLSPKVLTSDQNLSVQAHGFDEMFVSLEDGDIYAGLKANVTNEQFEAVLKGEAIDVPGVGNNITDITQLLMPHPVSKGQILIVKAGTIHSYGRVRVYEVKAVTPEEDRDGTISFCDRLKYLGWDNVRWQTEIKQARTRLDAQKTRLETRSTTESLSAADAALLGSIQQVLANAAGIAVETIETVNNLNAVTPELLALVNFDRRHKDVMTMTDAQKKKVVDFFKKFSKTGALDKLILANTQFTPVTVEAQENAQFKVVGATNRFIACQFELGLNGSLKQPAVLAGRGHALLVTKGDVKITVTRSDNTTYTVELGQGAELFITAGMQYSLTGNNKDVSTVFTQVMPLASTPANIIAAAQIGRNPATVLSRAEVGETSEADAAGTIGAGIEANLKTGRIVQLREDGVAQDLISVTQEEPYTIKTEDRKFVALELTSGAVSVNGQALIKERPIVMSVKADEPVELTGTGKIKAVYPETPEDQAVLATLYALQAYSKGGKIQEALAKSKKTGIQILSSNNTASALFRTKGKSNEEWRRQDLEKTFSDALGVKVSISTASDWKQAVIQDDMLAVAMFTDEELKGISDDQPQLQRFAGIARTPVLPQKLVAEVNSAGKNGWFYTAELLEVAIMAACTDTTDIQDEGSTYGQALQTAVNSMTGNSIRSISDLSDLLPFTGAEIPQTPDGLFGRFRNLIQNILITLPAKQFDPQAELNKRRQVLWSA